MDKQIEEMDIFCFRAVLERVDGKGEFIIPFEVLAGDKFKAQTILENWLKNPEQTGYKFTRCVGITREASKRLLVKGYSKASEVAEEIFAEIEEAREWWRTVYNADHFGYSDSAYGYLESDVDHTIYELKKKYAEGEG